MFTIAAIAFEGPASKEFDPLTFWITVAVVACFGLMTLAALIRGR